MIVLNDFPQNETVQLLIHKDHILHHEVLSELFPPYALKSPAALILTRFVFPG